jgi:hypothetical protein
MVDFSAGKETKVLIMVWSNGTLPIVRVNKKKQC